MKQRDEAFSEYSNIFAFSSCGLGFCCISIWMYFTSPFYVFQISMCTQPYMYIVYIIIEVVCIFCEKYISLRQDKTEM